NVLDLSPGSATMVALQALVNRGGAVSYLPQRQPPALVMNTNWIIAPNAPSWLYFYLSDNAPSSDLSVAASASNTNLIPGANLLAYQDVTGNGPNWFLEVTP